jgi:hypothetical protein
MVHRYFFKTNFILLNYYFDLFIRRHGAEDNLGEALRRKHVKTNAANDSILFDEHQTLVLGIKDKTRYVFAWHARQLM